jgi:transcriptional regulator with XRE-family HTH domain
MKGFGNRVRQLRKSKSLTLVELSKKTGIDQATLSRIENGLMTGTLDSHMKIAESLGLRLPELYSTVLEKAEESREKSVKKKLESFSHSGGTVAELLTTGVLQKKMLPVLLKIKAEGRTETEEYPPSTERWIYVVKGALETTLGNEKKMLSAGDSLYFDASLPHRFANLTHTEVSCLSVITPVSL